RALIGLFVAVLTLRPSVGGTVLLGASFVAYAIVAIATGTALWPRLWGVGPDLDKEWRRRKGISEHELKWRFASRYQKDLRTNKDKLPPQRICLSISVIGLTVETVFVAAGLLSVG